LLSFEDTSYAASSRATACTSQTAEPITPWFAASSKSHQRSSM